jgi:hypothetical protein
VWGGGTADGCLGSWVSREGMGRRKLMGFQSRGVASSVRGRCCVACISGGEGREEQREEVEDNMNGKNDGGQTFCSSKLLNIFFRL